MKHIKEDKAREVSEYQGRPVTSYKSEACKAALEGSVVKYTPEYDVYETAAELKEQGKWPNDSTILDFVNNRAKTSAVAEAYQTAIKPFKAEYDESPEKARADFIKSALNAPGMTLEKANAIADSVGFKVA